MKDRSIYSLGDCPVCADSGAVLLVKAIGSGQLLFYCPLCGVVWRQPPEGHIKDDDIVALRTLAPKGVSLPTSAEALASGLRLITVPFDDWFRFLEDDLSE
jgi:hypothetical protein